MRSPHRVIRVLCVRNSDYSFKIIDTVKDFLFYYGFGITPRLIKTIKNLSGKLLVTTLR